MALSGAGFQRFQAFSQSFLCNRFNIYCSYQQFFAGYYRNFADLCVQHPNWVEPNGDCPTCDSYESRLAELLGLSHGPKSAIPSVAASGAIREIAWESDRQFA